LADLRRKPVIPAQGAQEENPLKSVEFAFRNAHPALRTVIVPDAGHCGHQDNPIFLDAAIEHFPDDELAAD
jgi:pimeloyl-ACP methyl ester carboxylesterase